MSFPTYFLMPERLDRIAKDIEAIHAQQPLILWLLPVNVLILRTDSQIVGNGIGYMQCVLR